MSHRALAAALLVWVCLAGSVVQADSGADAAARSFALGTDLLRKGDLEGALKAFGSAARAEGAKAEYRQQYMLLRRVLNTREVVAREKDPRRWWPMAVALANFYYSRGLYAEALTLGKQMHGKSPTAHSATIVADAYLALGQNAEAEKVLAAMDHEGLTLRAKTLLGIALARQKKAGKAKAVLGEIAMPATPSPRFLVDVARLKVLCGEVDGGMATLTSALKSTSPRALGHLKDHVKKHADFASVATGQRFAEVLRTESEVVESSCSRGAGCGSCPVRGGCPSRGGGPAGDR